MRSITYKQGVNVLGDLTYEYDANGRRTKMGGSFARDVTPQPLITATYNAANQQLTFGSRNLSYDLNGNLTSDGANTFTWDSRDRLTSISGPNMSVSFQSDATGRRILKNINGATTNFLYDGPNVVQEQSAQLGIVNLLSSRIDEIFTRSDSTGSFSLLTDGLGSTLSVTDAPGSVHKEYAYGPFWSIGRQRCNR